jgi:GGDEF domain-containing protein
MPRPLRCDRETTAAAPEPTFSTSMSNLPSLGPFVWALSLIMAVAVIGVIWALRGPRRAPLKSRPAADSTNDTVTGLMLRPAFEHALSRILDSERGAVRSGALIYVGLDGFRLVNESHGHAQGDRVLGATSRKLRELCGAAVPMCRMAGDEFAIWLQAPCK